MINKRHKSFDYFSPIFIPIEHELPAKNPRIISQGSNHPVYLLNQLKFCQLQGHHPFVLVHPWYKDSRPYSSSSNELDRLNQIKFWIFKKVKWFCFEKNKNQNLTKFFPSYELILRIIWSNQINFWNSF